MPDIRNHFTRQIVHFVIGLSVCGRRGACAVAAAARRSLPLPGARWRRRCTDPAAPWPRWPPSSRAPTPTARSSASRFARSRCMEHEEWGERTRNVFVAIAVLEIAALALRLAPQARHRGLRVVTALGGLFGVWAVLRGRRSGRRHRLRACGAGPASARASRRTCATSWSPGLYHNARLARDAGRRRTRRRGSPTSWCCRCRTIRPCASWASNPQIKDRGEPRAALVTLAAMDPSGRRRAPPDAQGDAVGRRLPRAGGSPTRRPRCCRGSSSATRTIRA